MSCIDEPIEEIPIAEAEGIFIPWYIIGNDDLSWTAKAIWALIGPLSQKTGWCYASNKWFADKLHLTEDRVSRCISELVKAELVTVGPYNGRSRLLKKNKTRQGQQFRPGEVAKSDPLSTPTYSKDYSKEDSKGIPPLQSPVGELECEPSFEEVAAMEQDGDEPLTLSVGTDVPAARMSKAEFRKLADKMGFVVQPRRKVDPAVVEHIYSLYPKKVGKAAALKAIAGALQKVDAAVLIEAVTAYAAARKDQPKKYTKDPSGWFGDGRWEDDRSTWVLEPDAATTRKFRAKNGKMLDSLDDVESYEGHNAGFAYDMWTLPERIWHKYPELQY